MKSLNSNLVQVRDLLLSIEERVPVYHYFRPSRESLERYIIWAEDGETASLMVNNRKAEQQVTGTIDLFTLQEFDPAIDQIQQALDEAETLAWSLNSVQYEDETNLIHYEWEFSVI